MARRLGPPGGPIVKRAAPCDPGRQFRVGDCSVAVRSDLPEVLRDLGQLYAPAEAPGAGPLLRVEVTRRRGAQLPGRRRYDVLADGEPFGKRLGRREVLPWVEWAINWRYLRTCRKYLLLHAASLVRDGRGVILAGSAGAGKSTLVAGLLARGWEYLCDEFALIDPGTLHLHPFPKPICVKEGAFDTVRRLGLPLLPESRAGAASHHVKALKGRVGYVSGAGRVGAPSLVRLVVFPRYLPGAPIHARPVAPARAAFILSSLALNHGAFGPGAEAILARVVRGARCLALESGDLASACDHIDSQVCRPC